MPSKAPTANCFHLDYMPLKRQFFFCTDYKEEMYVWVTAIQRYIDGDAPRERGDVERMTTVKSARFSTMSLMSDTKSDTSEETTDTESWGDLFDSHRFRFSIVSPTQSSTSHRNTCYSDPTLSHT
eukprot:TRINITY_DN681_c0_g1_i3.p1 TRINITY_DN681_c0_g1~~TRINITY_DN681_c0_g1_i3.p1  ORF type:complete len:125 (-),score=35.20 TRINITY_DN681_c0_g1_i3:180-554(-)